MKRTEFRLWPWGMLALASGAAAVVAAYALAGSSAQNPRSRPDEAWRIAAITFSVLAAGNGYLLAIGTGDFGRSLLALPLSAAIGFLTVSMLRLPYMAGICAILLLMFMVDNFILWISGESFGARVLLGCTALGVILMVIGFNMGGTNTNGSSMDNPPGFSLVLSYPIVMALITASMPVDWTLDDMFGALLTGTRAGLYGLLIGAAAFFPGTVVMSSIRTLAPNLPVVGSVFVDGLAISLLAANFTCVKILLEGARRAEATLVEATS